MPLKDEQDVLTISKARQVTHRRRHNRLTNALFDMLDDYRLLEGRSKDCLFDVMVKTYDGKHDLIVEVKSSCEKPHIRMAVGQVCDYWFCIKGATTDCHVALLLPKEPDDDVKGYLRWMNIGVLWIDQKSLRTDTPSLQSLVAGTLRAPDSENG